MSDRSGKREQGEREADVIVVGTGAGGATVARGLALAGIHVLLVEEGPDLRHRPTEPNALGAMTARFRDFGATVATGGGAVIPLIQGVLVGGSTAINSAIWWRLPEHVYGEWIAQDPKLRDALSYRVIDDAAAAMERAASVRPVEAQVQGQNNLLLEKATAALGVEGHVIRRAESGCQGSGRCMFGCKERRRQGMDVSFIPDALAAGAELAADTVVSRVRIRAGRAEGVDVLSNKKPSFIRARRGVVLAAGALHTPHLLARSGIAGAVGARFTAHPGFSVGGFFDTPVRPGAGATQGYESTHLGSLGMKVEALGLPRALAAARLPGAGGLMRSLVDDLDHLAVWGCLLRPSRHGRVKAGIFGGPAASIPLYRNDLDRALVGVKHLVDLMFAAGARRVLPGIAGAPKVIERPSMLDAVRSISPRQLSWVATHLFGGAVLGTDASQAVVGPDFAVHGIRGLFVADASVIPTSLGVNPQGTIMSLAHVAAGRIEGRLMQA
jgi:choline dehydrogenase-like flavoprotein